METIQNTQINLTHYAELCPDCRQPARAEVINDSYPNENELFYFCVNPRCINFDGLALKAKRQKLEAKVRESKTFKRYQHRLWKTEAHRYKAMRTRKVSMV